MKQELEKKTTRLEAAKVQFAVDRAVLELRSDPPRPASYSEPDHAIVVRKELDRTLENNQSRRTRAGSVRLARHAGKTHAEIAITIITTSADANTTGSSGLT